MAKSKLEYWSGSAWVQAKTIDFGQGTQNALLSLEIEDKLNSAMKARIMLSNAAKEPFKVVADDDDVDRFGPLTNVFTDFMPVRILDATNVVLFSGKLYDIKNVYDTQYGHVTKLYARDNLAELADIPTDAKDADIAVSATDGSYPAVINTRSELIKTIIRDSASDPHSSTLNISSANIDFSDATKFIESVRTFDEDAEYSVNSLSREGLKAIYEIAKNDPHEASGEVANYGYDYYVDSNYTVASDATAAADLNYFKRGTRTPFQGTPTNFKGAWIEYPIASGFVTTGLKQMMFPDYDFNLPKSVLYTGAVTAMSRNAVTTRTDEDGLKHSESISEDVSIDMEILEGTFGGGSSGQFAWKNKKLIRVNEVVSTNNPVGDYAEDLYNAGSVSVGRVQYQSATSGAGYIIISFERDLSSSRAKNTQQKRFNALDSETQVLTGAISGATFTFNTDTGRPSKSFGIVRPLRISGNDAKGVDSMRRRVASALYRSKDTHTDCTVRVLPRPYTYVDTTAASVTNSTTVVLNQVASSNIDVYGFRRGMTIAKVDANGNQTAYGYASSVSTNTVVVTLNTGDWDTGGDYAGTIRIYMPVRASHYIYARNLLAGFTGYMFLKSVLYTEGIGSQVTQYAGSGVNTAGSTIGRPINPNQIIASIESESGKYPKHVNVPAGSLAWTYRPIDATNTAVFSSTDRDTIAWTGGELAVGQMSKYKIRASNSGNMSTTSNDVGSTFYPFIYKIIFDPTQVPDGSGTYNFEVIKETDYSPNMDHTILGHARAGRLAGLDAVLIFDGTGTGGAGGVDAAGEDQFSAALFKKAVQPWTTDVSIYPGKTSSSSASVSAPDNLQRYVHVTNGVAGTGVNGTISFADNTTVPLNYNPGTANTVPRPNLDLTVTDNLTSYVYFMLADSSNAETSDFTAATQAIVSLSATYSNATSDSRGLLAICSTGDTSELDEVAIQAFHSKGQNITANSIAANAITAGAIKTGSLNSHVITITGDGRIVTTASMDRAGSSEWSTGAGGILIDNAGILGTSGADTDISSTEFYIKASDGRAYFGGGLVKADKTGLTIGESAGSGGSTGFLRWLAPDVSNAFIFRAQATDSDYQKGNIVFQAPQDLLMFGSILGNMSVGNPVSDIGNAPGSSPVHRPFRDIFTKHIQASVGTEALPSHTFFDDVDTGMYRKAANGLAFTVGGVDVLGIVNGIVYPVDDDVTDLGYTTGGNWRWDNIYATNTTVSTSDRREKTDISPTKLGLDFINDLKPVSYKWKRKPERPTFYGLIAQEVLETLEEHGIESRDGFGGITGGTEGTFYGARYEEFIAILIKAVQELSDKVKTLEEEK